MRGAVRRRLRIARLVVSAVVMLYLVAAAMGGQELDCSFAKGQWSPDAWILVKSPRSDHFGKWIQQDDHIENETPPGASPKEFLGKLAPQTYSSMVLKKKCTGTATISAEMAFSDRMAPLIVIAPELGEDAKGVPEYREHFEIIIFDEGVNVWHHFFADGKPSWRIAAYSRFSLAPNTRYTLTVRITHTAKGKKMSVTVGGHEMGYSDDSLPDSYHVGITGCEGINRFYRFKVEQ